MRLVCSFVIFSALVWGQAFQGSLRGRVTDPKDSIVPLAKVTIIEDATAVSSSTVTNQQGVYSFPTLNPSTYTLVVEAPGFKKLEKKDIIISTQSSVNEDAFWMIFPLLLLVLLPENGMGRMRESTLRKSTLRVITS